MDSTHSSAVLSIGVLVPVIHWLTTWPIKSPDDITVASLAALLIASPPAIKALAAWLKPPPEKAKVGP